MHFTVNAPSQRKEFGSVQVDVLGTVLEVGRAQSQCQGYRRQHEAGALSDEP
jgi:hypothetical protein